MIMKKSVNKLIYVLALFFAFSSCEKAPLGTTKHTDEWLKNKSDAKLAFTSNTGQKEELAITVTESTRTSSGKNIPTTYQVYTLTYTGKQADLGLVVQAEHNAIRIRNIGQSGFDTNFVDFTTGKSPADEVTLGHDVEAELTDNLTLNGVRYDRVLRLKFFLPSNRPDKIKEIYYAKNHGLVYFQTTDGQYWALD